MPNYTYRAAAAAAALPFASLVLATASLAASFTLKVAVGAACGGAPTVGTPSADLVAASLRKALEGASTEGPFPGIFACRGPRRARESRRSLGEAVP